MYNYRKQGGNIMKCEFCGTSSLRGIKVKNHKDIVIPITFCCYECYLAFWKDVKGFVPLPEFVPEPNPILYVPEPVKKKRIYKHTNPKSYTKSAYCF